jgi:hypothetical protein
MKTITECESKHCKAWPLFSLVCAGVIATFMAGCAEAREIPYYPTYPTGNSTGIQASRGGLAVQGILPFEPESSYQAKY